MESIWNRNVKEVITEFPSVADILNGFGIGCAACDSGTCMLGDVVSLHPLPADQEKSLRARIEHAAGAADAVIPPEQESAVPVALPREFHYSPPVRILVDEHLLIKRFIALIPDFIARLDLESEEDRALVLDAVDFIRNYADGLHHAKEENILFEYFSRDLDVIKAMYADHTTGRDHVRAVLEAVDARDTDAASRHLLSYRELLQEHIKKEDEILFPWMDRELTMRQIGELHEKFAAADRLRGPDFTDRYERFVAHLENNFHSREGNTDEQAARI